MLPDRLRTLGYLLARLPGVGEKTAQRFALYFATDGRALSKQLGGALVELTDHVGTCTRCNNIAETDEQGRCECDVCKDTRRDGSLLCIVGKISDLLAIERSGSMRGRYFVLGKLLSPLDGVGTDELPLAAIERRIAEDQVKEVILATPPSVEGEATALWLARELGRLGVNISRIASGVPHGGDLEFADQITLGRAISGRREVGSQQE